MSNAIGGAGRSPRTLQSEKSKELKKRAENRLEKNPKLFRDLTGYFIKSNSFSASSKELKILSEKDFSFSKAQNYIANHPENKKFVKVIQDVVSDIVQKEKDLDLILGDCLDKKDQEGMILALKKGASVFSLNQFQIGQLLVVSKGLPSKIK
jgi:hypothetical protein